MDRCLFLFLLFTELSVLPTCLSVRYHFIAEPKTLGEAQKNCSQNLPVMATAEEVTEIDMFNTVTANWNENTWLEMKSWRWSLDGTELRSFEAVETFWDRNQPDNSEAHKEFCVFTRNGKWHDEACSKELYFVCYDEKNKKKKYIYINLKFKWAESQRYCRHNYTDLASVRNTTERNDLKRILDPEDKDVWIGLHKLPCVWGWYNSSGSSKNCLQSSLDKRPFICYDDELVLVQQNKTWSEALWYCRNQSWELVSVLNQNIQNWVQKKADNASSLYVWLGLRYSCALDFWFWVSGNVSCYQNWSGGQGHNPSNEQCGVTGAMERGGRQWVNLSETEKHNFICSKSQVPTSANEPSATQWTTML